MIPLFKKGDSKLPNNYRPISLLSSFSKIIEKVLKTRILCFLDKYELLSETQFGFRCNRSTEDALHCVLNCVISSINDHKTVSCLFLDITKAFDMVDHNILLERLWKYGFRGVSLDWFRSYLTNRKMCVKIENVLSNEKTICSGVPQGSVLGPVLFLIFFDSLLRMNLKGKCVAFADDLAITYNSKTRHEIEQWMNDDLKRVRFWFDTSGLILSTKSKCMFFDLIKPSRTSKIMYHKLSCAADNFECNSDDCVEVEQVDDFPYLGIILDRKMSFKNHSIALSKELRKTTRNFYLLRDLCPHQILINLYYALVYSRLQYGISCWGGAYSNNLDNVQKIQKSVVRILTFNNSRHPSLPLFRLLKILPLKYIFVFKVLKIFFNRSGHTVLQENGYTLRKGERCLVPFPNKEFYRRSFLFIGPNVFNKLPSHIKNASSSPKFDKLVKEWLLSMDSIDHLFNSIGT